MSPDKPGRLLRFELLFPSSNFRAMQLKLISLLGLVAFVAVAWALSYNRKLFPWRTVFWGIALQFIFAVLILKTAWGMAAPSTS
jgi:hypothetical protein